MFRPHARTLSLLASFIVASCSGDDDGGRDIATSTDTSVADDVPDSTAPPDVAPDVPPDVPLDGDTPGIDVPDVDVPDVEVPTEGGLLVPPDGRAASDYEVGNEAGEVAVQADGTFVFGDPGTGVKVTVATPLDAADLDLNVLMAITVAPPGEPAPRGVLVSARTTAVALAFLTPLVATHDPHRARAILEVAAHLPEVDVLASLVQAYHGARTDPLADADFARARDEAIAALALAAAQLPAVPVPPAGGGPRATDRSGHHVHHLDPASHVEVTVEGDDVIIETRSGVPLASIFRIDEINIDALHTIDRERLRALGNADGLLLSATQSDDLRSHTRCGDGTDAFYPRFTTLADSDKLGHTSGDSYFARLDLAGQAVDFIFEVGLEAAADAVGFDLEPEGKLPITTSRPGLYVLRAFNGLRGDGVDCAEQAFAGAHFGVESRSAFALNLTLTAFDVLAFVIDVRDYWGNCVADNVRANLDGERNYDGTFEDLWDMFGDAVRFGGQCVADALLDFVGDQGQEAAIRAGKRVGRVVRTFAEPLANKTTFTKVDDLLANLVRKLDPFAYAAIAGTIVDRLWTLFGGGKSAVAWVTGGYFGHSTLSPVDTWLVRIGDPFGPRVGTIEVGGVPTGITLARDRQVLVKVGTTVTLVGASLVEDGQPIGDVLLTAKSGAVARVPAAAAGADRLTFVVPDGLADVVTLDLVTPMATIRVGTVLVIEPELIGVAPRDLFRVAKDGAGKPLYDVGGDYVPEVALRGRGFDPQKMVVRPTGATTAQAFVTRSASHDQRLVLGDDVDIATGVHTLVLDTGITSPAFLAKYPDGRVTSTLEVRILPAPEHTATSPTAVASGQVFQLTGANFGTDREAVALEVLAGASSPSTYALDVFFVTDAPSGSGVQPSILAARLVHLVGRPWMPDTAPLTLRLTTPAGQVDIDVPLDATPPANVLRRVEVHDPSGWGKAVAILNGTYAGADLAEVFTWIYESAPHPNGEDVVHWCAADPGSADWPLEDNGVNPVGVSRPPGMEASSSGGCARTCLYDGDWVQTTWDGPPVFLYDPTNVALGLPTSPCPTSWAGIAPAALRQALVADGPLTLAPATIDAYELGVLIDIESGGGFTFRGFDGRSKLTGEISIAEPRVPDPDMPLIVLDGIENVDLRLDLRNAVGCNVGVLIKNAKDVRLQDPLIEGCKTGIVIEDSEGVVIQEGSVRGYGDGGVGIAIRASQSVRITRTLVRPDKPGDSTAITFSARGVVVSHGSQGVRVTVEARKNGKGIEVLDAQDVVVGGWIGAARDGSDPGTNAANGIGIDIVGPARDVTIGGNPAKFISAADPDTSPTGETTIVADNGRTGGLPGAGIRLGDVLRVKVSRAYIGVVPGQLNEGNRVGIEVLAAARDVVIERCHLGDNTEAGIDIVGNTGSVIVRDVLFAGRELASWAHRRAFPKVVAGFAAAARCTLDRLLDDTFDAELAPAFAASAGGPGIRLRDGAEGVAIERVASLGAPLVMTDAARVRVRDVDVWGVDGEGVRVVTSQDVALVGVQVWKSAGSGIAIDGSAGVRFEGCAAANGLAGVEVTGVPGPRQGGFDGGRKAQPSTGSVIVDPTPVAADWQHLPALLAHGADAVLLVDNGTHGLWAHEGAVPVTLSHATVVGNAEDGVHVDVYAAPTMVRGSAIGVLVDGDDTLPDGNGGSGVFAIGATAEVVVGDAQADGGNVVSSNVRAGVMFDGAAVARIAASFIGTDVTGLVDMGNGVDGVSATDVDRLFIGGVGPQSNVISGNARHGVALEPGTVGDALLVRQNRIGVDAQAGLALPNDVHGVDIGACVAPGVAPRIVGNLVAGNGLGGVVARGCDGGLEVRDNGVGVGNLGRVDNGGDNIVLFDSDDAWVDGNIVRGGGHGVVIFGGTGNRVDANLVFEVGEDGVRIEGGADLNRVKDSVILDVGGDGIGVYGGSAGNTFTQNSITASGGDAIRLVGGGNLGMPSPVITFADPREASGPGTWRVTGVVSSPGAARIELFADPDDEARVPLTVQPAFAIGGRWTFEYVAEPPPSALAPQASLEDLVICATATDFFGNTSEVGCTTVGGQVACPLGGEPPEETSLAGHVVTRRDGALALTDFTGGSRDATMLVPGGGEASACGDRVVFSGGTEGARDLFLYDFGAGQATQLTSGASDDVEPAISPDCLTVAFASDRGGAFDIYQVGVDGGDLHALTNDGEEDRSPAWSDDGEAIVFARLGDESWGLWQTTGGAPTVVLDGPGDERDPSWHPDVARVVYVRCAGDEACELRVFDLDLGLDAPMAPAACDDRGPAWVVSPDTGETALLVSRRAVGATGGGALPHVVLLGASGTPLWRVTPTTSADDAPACCLEAP